MTPQKRYHEWKTSQGLSINGKDITSGDTLQSTPLTLGENAIRSAVMIYFVLHKKENR